MSNAESGTFGYISVKEQKTDSTTHLQVLCYPFKITNKMGTNLQGNYNFLQGILENNLQSLKIKSRRAQSDKPHFYLVGINPDESEAYISSLYPHQVDWSLNKHFQFDYGGDYYLLTIDEWNNVAEIKKIGVKKVRAQNRRVWGDEFGSKRRKGTRNSPNAINNGELGTKIVPVW